MKDKIDDWDIMVFAVFYHDIVYNVLRRDNEERSAILAGVRLAELGVPKVKIDKCKDLITATGSHAGGDNGDVNYLLDADLAVLGSEWLTYWAYVLQVRKEFAVFPDVIFKPGRRKVLHYFLGMDRIFKSDEFYEAYEKRARENLHRELEYWENRH